MKKMMYLFFGFFLLLNACNSRSEIMTENEIKLIANGDATQPMRVLLTTSQDDSLFLRQQCVDIDAQKIKENKTLKLLIQRMKATLADQQGVGLAAPQVGIGYNIFLFMRVTEPDFPVQVVINPTITKHPEETICFEGDGCLSIPDIGGNSIRYPWIEVEYYDEDGRRIKERLDGYSREVGFTGVIFQHEFDHLQGVLFIDKLCDLDN